MFEALTIPARQILASATEAAVGLGSHEVEGAHLLLGFLGTPSALQATVARYLPDHDVLCGEVQRLTLRSASGAHPSFGEEVCLAIATARGISVGRGTPSTGSATLLLGLLTLAPRSVTELFDSQQVDVDAFCRACAVVDDGDEPIAAPPGGATWTVTIGATDPTVVWTDQGT
jgi:hypothetical protein